MILRETGRAALLLPSPRRQWPSITSSSDSNEWWQEVSEARPPRSRRQTAVIPGVHRRDNSIGIRSACARLFRRRLAGPWPLLSGAWSSIPRTACRRSSRGSRPWTSVTPRASAASFIQLDRQLRQKPARFIRSMFCTSVRARRCSTRRRNAAASSSVRVLSSSGMGASSFSSRRGGPEIFRPWHR